jgi:hypothetical protein
LLALIFRETIVAKSYIGVIKHFQAAPEKVQGYFPDFVSLVEDYNWEVSVSYVFSRIEQAKRMTIYCGITKLHWADSSLTWKLVSEDYLSRARFYELFKDVFGKKIPDSIRTKLESAEDVRDKIAHGMSWSAADARVALTNVVDFADEFNTFVNREAGFQPFGDLRGYKGRAEPLTKATTRWILRGMGIPKKAEN